MVKKTWFLYPILFLCGMVIAYGVNEVKTDAPLKQDTHSNNEVKTDVPSEQDMYSNVDDEISEDDSDDIEETNNLPDSYYLSYKESDQPEGKAGFQASEFTLEEPRDFVMLVKKYKGRIQIRFTEQDSGTELYSSGAIGDEFNDTVHLEPGFYRFHLDTYIFRGVLDVQGVKTDAD